MVVAADYDCTITFGEIFDERRNQPQRGKRKHDGGPTPIYDTMEEYVDQYLKNGGYQWTSSEFFDWKKMMDDLNAHEDMTRRKDKFSNRTRKGKFDRKNSLKGHKGRRHCDNICHKKSTIKHAKSTSRQ